MTRLYIAGKMSGLKHFGFEAFDEAADNLRLCGYEVISPAEMDRERGFDPIALNLNGNESRELLAHLGFDGAKVIIEDLEAINTCDGVALLPWWESSKGTAVEVAFANFRDIPVKRVEEWVVVCEVLKDLSLEAS